MQPCHRNFCLVLLGVVLVNQTGCTWMGPWSPTARLERNSLFQPARHPAGEWDQTTVLVQDAQFAAADGTRLHGWYVRHPQPRAHALLLHGNAGNVTILADT